MDQHMMQVDNASSSTNYVLSASNTTAPATYYAASALTSAKA